MVKNFSRRRSLWARWSLTCNDSPTSTTPRATAWSAAPATTILFTTREIMLRLRAAAATTQLKIGEKNPQSSATRATIRFGIRARIPQCSAATATILFSITKTVISTACLYSATAEKMWRSTAATAMTIFITKAITLRCSAETAMILWRMTDFVAEQKMFPCSAARAMIPL